MKKKRDTEKLREDLMDHFGTAAASGMGAAIMDVIEVEHASKEELKKIARENGFDPDEYTD